eukprot:GEMP01090795.1.p2 GENE.GEMP01090795.1~~GEMP01090795.1.p2  ORF type:complete len:144 (+),score=14.32 GEMP01090795.1:416-847(+)
MCVGSQLAQKIFLFMRKLSAPLFIFVCVSGKNKMRVDAKFCDFFCFLGKSARSFAFCAKKKQLRLDSIQLYKKYVFVYKNTRGFLFFRKKTLLGSIGTKKSMFAGELFRRLCFFPNGVSQTFAGNEHWLQKSGEYSRHTSVVV